SRLATNLPGGGLLAVDYVASFWNNELPLWVLSGVGVGIVFQLVFLNPAWRPPQRSDIVSVYSRSLRARFLVFSIPLVLLIIVLSVLAVTSRAITLAREQAIAEMSRSADNASERLRQFFYTSSNLLTTFAEDPALLDPERRAQALRTDRQVVPFFQELLIVNPSLGVVEAVPEDEARAGLTMEERLEAEKALDVGFLQMTRISTLPSGEYGLTAVQPIFQEEDWNNPSNEQGPPVALLLGRARLNVNPYMQQALDALQLTRGTGTGFILDEWGAIIAHPNPDFILRPWEGQMDAVPEPGTGAAYEEVSPDGQRLLTYLHNSRGTPYTVVLQLPYAAVLETATAIASPLLMVQIAVGGILLFAIPFYATRIIKPLNKLAEAANHIARGDLNISVSISPLSRCGFASGRDWTISRCCWMSPRPSRRRWISNGAFCPF
ncbi:MAG: HAMP domain-containing protein, partial [Chloroflexi bacterium]|nr:HAMP domain-containing protein [Chloroflexota bacterium]